MRGEILGRIGRFGDIQGLAAQKAAHRVAVGQREAEDGVDGLAIDRQADASSIRQQRLDAMLVRGTIRRTW